MPESLRAALKAQTRLAGQAQDGLVALKAAMVAAETVEGLHPRTRAFGKSLRQAQEALRDVLDQAEKDCAADLWPMPVYRELMAPLI